MSLREFRRKRFSRAVRKRRRCTPLRMEMLEDRRMLAAVITLPPNVISSAAGLFDEGLSLIPEDLRNQIFGAVPDQAEDVLNQIVDAIDSAAIYQAFPGEVNNVSFASDFGNLVLLVNESSDVSLIKSSVLPALPAFTFDQVLQALIPDFNFGISFGGDGGPLVVEVGGDAQGDITIKGEQIRGIIDSMFDMSSARAMLFNPSAFLDFIPGLSNVTNVVGNLIDFDIADILDFNLDIDPIIDIDLPFGLPDIEIPPNIDVNIADLLADASIPTSFRDLADILPGPVGSVFEIITGAVDFLTGDLVNDRIFISTLDGPDNISFPNVTGLPFTVYAGTGPDTITVGGGSSFVDSLVDVFDVFDLNQFFDDAPIELFGQGGPDTFILNRRFNNRELTINGGGSNDQLIVRGSDQADIIEIEADANGMLHEIRYFVPDPNGNVATNEIQTVTLPSGVNGGTFTLSFTARSNVSATTDPLPFNADGAAVEAELQNLSNIGSGEVNVAGPNGGPYIITFANGLGAANQRLLTGDGSNLTRLGTTVAAQEVQDGNPETGRNQIQRIDLPPNTASSNPNESPYINGGTFNLTFEGNTTELLSFNASNSRVREALEALPTINSGDVVVTGSPGGPWLVEFTGDRAVTEPGFTPPPLITADGFSPPSVTGPNLTGGVSSTLTSLDGAPLQAAVSLPAPLAGQALGGEFTLSVDGASTAPLPSNASAAQIRDALENLPNANNVSVIGSFGGLWDVTLSGSGAAGGITGDPAALTGGVDLAVAETNPTAVNEDISIDFCTVATSLDFCGGVVTDGTFTMTVTAEVGGFSVDRTTDPIPYDATAAEFQTALEALSNVGPGNVLVTKSSISPNDTFTRWNIVFTGELSGQDLPLPVLDTSGLITTGAPAVSTTVNANGSPGVNETQDITLSPVPTGGDFTLTFMGETTPSIPFNASGAQVQSILESLGAIRPGDIRVTKVASTYTVEFVGLQSALNQPPFSGDPSNLTGGFPPNGSVTVTQTQAPANEVQNFSFSPSPDGGTFQLRFRGETTTNLSAVATPSDVETALENLSTIDDVAVVSAPGGFEVTFAEELSATNTESLVVVTSGLSRDEPILVEVSQTASLTNEIQRVQLPQQVSGGTFTLSFQSLMIEETTQGGGGANEQQTISLPAGTAGGSFSLTFGGNTTPDIPAGADASDVRDALANLPSISGASNIAVSGPTGGPWVVEFTGTFADTDVALIQSDGSNLTGAFTTSALDFDATAVDVQTALEGLAALNAGDVDVTTPEVNIAQNIRGRTGVNEVQSITLPDNTTGGEFRLEFEGAMTAPIAAGATAADIKTALDGLVTGLVVAVTGGTGGPWSVAFQGTRAATDVELMEATSSELNLAAGPWTVEFVGDYEGKSLQLLTVDGVNLQSSGRGDPAVETNVQGGDGTPQQVSTKRFNSFTEVEHLRIEGGDGDDIVRIIGPPRLPLGIMYDAGGGTDVLEIVSNDSTPSFTSPIFPDDTQATVFVDGQAIQFADMEGGLVYDANNQAGAASLSGTDAANEIRFNGTGAGAATFANDGQVTTTLRNFAPGSTVSLLGEQGGDDIAVQLNGVTAFTSFNIDGGGPVGTDTVRFEGTTGMDSFALTPGSTVEDGRVVVDSIVTLDYTGISGTTFVGLGGLDSLTVNEAAPDTDDAILFFPRAENDGSFQLTSRSGGPETALVYPPVEFESIENRTFSTGTGSDTLNISSDDLPGVNSSASVVGGNGVTIASFADQSITFAHDTTEEDQLSFEIGTHTDDIVVTPGTGIAIAVNSSFGDDTLFYNAMAAPLVADISSRTLSHTGFGDVTHTGISQVNLIGSGAQPLSVVSGASAPLVYRPTGPQSGEFSSPAVLADYSFDVFTGTFTVDFNSSHDDEVIVQGTGAGDVITGSADSRVVGVTDSTGSVLMSVTLGPEVDIATIDARGGGDLIQISPDPGGGSQLLWNVDGGTPQALDRLVVEDQGVGNTVRNHQEPDERSGTVFVGDLLPVTYQNIERLDILPLDPVSGGTGIDGAGRIVVFHPDTFSANDSRLNPTELDDLFEHTAKPSIDPGGRTDPFGTGLDLPGDEDWYRFIAPNIGTFRFEVLHDQVPTLANGQPGLPGDGQLRIDLYESDGTPIVRLPTETDPAIQTIGVEEAERYLLRVRGEGVESINIYDIAVENLDEIGPQVFDPDGNGPNQAVHITGEPTYNLFDVKPSDGPTPPVLGLTINIRDLPARFPGFLYDALDDVQSASPGHFILKGDQGGRIDIQNVVIINDPVTAGEVATATIELAFAEFLPDDRYTLTLRDDIIDPAGNALDGESNAAEPNGGPDLPSGDGQAGGDFIARFTVDSRPELATYSAGTVYSDINGNFVFDPDGEDNDATNRDLIFHAPELTGYAFFAGDFTPTGAGASSGFDKLGAYGVNAHGNYEFRLDFDHDGVFNFISVTDVPSSATPIAGNFNNAKPGDEIGLFDGNRWIIDSNGDNMIELGVDQVIPTSMRGLPIVGDFNGDGVDDFALFDPATNEFVFDIDRDGIADSTVHFGFPGFTDRPVAGDFNLDGIDDIGLWVPGRQGQLPKDAAEWFLLLSDREHASPSEVFDDFSPAPLGNDVIGQFGDDSALPLFANLDPPVTRTVGPDPREFVGSWQNAADKLDVNGDGFVTPHDVVLLVNRQLREGAGLLPVLSVIETAPLFLDVNGDHFATVADIVPIIAHLNLSDPQAEGEADAARMPPALPLLAWPLQDPSSGERFASRDETEDLEPIEWQQDIEHLLAWLGPIRDDSSLSNALEQSISGIAGSLSEQSDRDLFDQALTSLLEEERLNPWGA